MKHQAGIWNGMWSDMFIETTFVRYGHGPGGLVDITWNQTAIKRWALSLNTCQKIVKDLTDLKNVDVHTIQITIKHKEESDTRKNSDDVDRTKIREKLSTCIDPLRPDEHQDGIMNIIAVMVHQNQVDIYEVITGAPWYSGSCSRLSIRGPGFESARRCV